MRLSRAQRNVVYVMAAFFALAIAIGFWPVNAAVFGAPSYSCGSGFLHSAHKWKTDSATSSNERTGNETATGTPSDICPDKVYNRRDFALVLIQDPQDRSSSALQASMRIRDRR